MADSVRVTCDVDGFANTWLELDAKITRREVMAIEAANDESFFTDLLRPRVVACHIERAGQPAITTPDDLTLDALLDCDEAVLGFIGRAIWIAIAQRRTLGNVGARLSLPTNGQTAAPTPLPTR